jgi:3-oxoacyl-[acyl-carrier protein] reductase
MLTRVLAQELWQYNISVNEIIPGPVQTPMTTEVSARSSDTVFDIDSEWIKTPEDVVPLALFLATQPTIGPTAQSFSLMRRDN